MSANNWTWCPQCQSRREDGIKKQQEAVAASYGKVSAQEYLALVEQVKKPPEARRTLREDYEVGVHDANFEIDYSCSCAECGLTFYFKETRPIPIT
jgi:hypothetical protein